MKAERSQFRRGCDALLQALQLAGVQKIFMFSGNHVVPAFGTPFSGCLPPICTPHEAAAMYMPMPTEVMGRLLPALTDARRP